MWTYITCRYFFDSRLSSLQLVTNLQVCSKHCTMRLVNHYLKFCAMFKAALKRNFVIALVCYKANFSRALVNKKDDFINALGAYIVQATSTTLHC